MGILSKLFGSGSTQPSSTKIPPACFDPFENNTKIILEAFAPVLPSLFGSAAANRPSAVAALIALDQPKWQGLILRMHEKPNLLYLTPESFTKAKVRKVNIGDQSTGPVWVYAAPVVAGRKMTVALFVVDLTALIQSFASINVPMMFPQIIQEEVQERLQQPGRFPVVVLATRDVDVFDLPS
jgi:hypothetical protein